MVIDIYGLASGVPAQLFYEIPGHARSEQMSDKPVTTTVRCESILQLIGSRIMHVFDVLLI
jgi:hypothetical protein